VLAHIAVLLPGTPLRRILHRNMEAAAMTYQNILVRTEGPVGVITLNRPQALNALSSALMDELSDAVDSFEADGQIRCMIITGSEKAFAAGADITEMQGKGFVEAYSQDFITRNWERITRARKPVIAAVAGFALGGGCELAMMCDLIIAADNAKFGQPEINLGIGPGAGGTQRLTRAVGKAKAMDLCLTGRMMDAAEAERSGLVARVVPLAELMTEAMRCAQKIASASLAAAMIIKESVNAAFETTLAQGIHLERRLFHAMFATEDQKEGMAAFVEKRKPAFKDR
jgi:enoyl-CoA hydratase